MMGSPYGYGYATLKRPGSNATVFKMTFLDPFILNTRNISFHLQVK